MTEDRLPLTSQAVLADKLAALRELFPEVFAEGKVDFARLKQVLGEAVDDGRERYGLSWAGKSEAIRNLQAQSVGTLTPVPEESVNFDITENIFIEGDNLEVLKLLQKSYHNQIKLIYIDPPYNTGKEFIYPDNFREGLEDYLRYSGQKNGEGIKLTTNTETDGRFHSKWLNMMYPRLYIARNLLRDDGIIFASIDDHEVDNLRLLLNEVFGEENFIAQLIWNKGKKNDAKLFSVGHEYLVIYARSKSNLREIGTVWREPKPGAQEIWDEYCRLREIHGKGDRFDKVIENALREWYKSLPDKHPSKALSRYKHIDKYGPWRDRDISWPGDGGPRYTVPHPKTKQPCKIPSTGWRFSTSEAMQKKINFGLVEFREDHTEPPFLKAHLRPISEELEDDENAYLNGEEEEAEIGMQVRSSYFYKQSQVAVKYLRGLMGEKIFNNPKDHEELAKLIDYCTSSDGDIILDFFAGSASTAEAVLKLNHRKSVRKHFIMVQLPEPTPERSTARNTGYNNIAEIGKERLRRVINKLNEEDDGRLDLFGTGQHDRGFKVFKLTESNFKIWDGTAPQDVEQLSVLLQEFAENIQLGTTKLGMLYEILLKTGFSLTTKIEALEIAGQEIFAIEDRELFICLEYELLDATVRQIVELQPRQFISLDSSFRGNDELKTNTQLQMRDHNIKFRTV